MKHWQNSENGHQIRTILSYIRVTYIFGKLWSSSTFFCRRSLSTINVMGLAGRRSSYYVTIIIASAWLFCPFLILFHIPFLHLDWVWHCLSWCKYGCHTLDCSLQCVWTPTVFVSCLMVNQLCEAYKVEWDFVYPRNNHNNGWTSPKSCSFTHWRRPFLLPYVLPSPQQISTELLGGFDRFQLYWLLTWRLPLTIWLDVSYDILTILNRK